MFAAFFATAVTVVGGFTALFGTNAVADAEAEAQEGA